MKSDFKKWVFALLIGIGVGSVIANPYVLNNDILGDGTISSSIASGSNAFAVATNGGRIDFGAGASDYASSDGTTVTFTGPIASTSITGTSIVVGTALAFSSTAPTISAACTSPTVTNGTTTAFQVDVGSTCAGISTIVLTVPATTNGTRCTADNITAPATRVVRQTAGWTGTSVTLTNFAIITDVAADFTDGTDLVINCTGR